MGSEEQQMGKLIKSEVFRKIQRIVSVQGEREVFIEFPLYFCLFFKEIPNKNLVAMKIKFFLNVIK